MTEGVLIAIFSAISVAIGGVYMLLYRHVNHCQDEVGKKIVEMSTKIDTLNDEVKRLRDMRHEIMEHTTHALAEWHANIIERFKR